MPVTIDGSNTPTAGGVGYGDGTELAFTSAGSAGQVLLSNGASAPSFGAVGVAGGGTGQSSLTANNVILGNGTSAVQFVAPGTNGNVLRSNGTTWTSAAVSSGALVFLSSATASNSATVDLETGFGATYDNYLVVFNGVQPVNNGPHLFARLKIGGSYQTSLYGYAALLNIGGSPSASQAVFNDSSIRITNTNGLGNGSGRSCQGQVMLCSVNDTSLGKLINWQVGYVNANSPAELTVFTGVGGYLNNTDALTGIRFFAQSGNINSGTFRLYGIANS